MVNALGMNLKVRESVLRSKAIHRHKGIFILQRTNKKGHYLASHIQNR